MIGFEFDDVFLFGSAVYMSESVRQVCISMCARVSVLLLHKKKHLQIIAKEYFGLFYAKLLISPILIFFFTF